MVINNGNMSSTFDLNRGIRQGCPISAFIFILCAEMLSEKLRTCKDVKGLVIGDITYKVTQFADDTALLLKDTNSFAEALKVLNIFYKCSGLKLNMSKTIVVKLGCANSDMENADDLLKLGFNWCTGSFRYLGIWFDTDDLIMEYKNFRHRLEKKSKIS